MVLPQLPCDAASESTDAAKSNNSTGSLLKSAMAWTSQRTPDRAELAVERMEKIQRTPPGPLQVAQVRRLLQPLQRGQSGRDASQQLEAASLLREMLASHEQPTVRRYPTRQPPAPHSSLEAGVRHGRTRVE